MPQIWSHWDWQYHHVLQFPTLAGLAIQTTICIHSVIYKTKYRVSTGVFCLLSKGYVVGPTKAKPKLVKLVSTCYHFSSMTWQGHWRRCLLPFAYQFFFKKFWNKFLFFCMVMIAHAWMLFYFRPSLSCPGGAGVS